MKRQHNTFQPRTGKQNIFRTVSVGRINFLFEFVTGLLFSLSSYPSYIVEVLFLRKKFGERYFTTANAFFISIILIILWFTIGDQGQEYIGVMWLPFIGLFLFQAIRHRREIKKFGTTYNFDRFSYSDGEIHPLWWKIINKEIWGFKVTQYHVHILLEPAVPIIIGMILAFIPPTRGVGILINYCGFFFGFRSFMKAHIARGHVLDTIDEQLVAKWKHDVLVEEKPKSETKGLSLPIKLPKSREIREQLSNSIDDNPLDIWDND